MNVFAGTGLNACLVPLYRGQSLFGTQYGAAVDTNVGPFVSGDYSESVGLSTGFNASKYLDTGFATSSVTAAEREVMHLSVSHGPLPAIETDPVMVGSFNGATDRYSLQVSIRNGALAYESGRAGKANAVTATAGVQGARTSAFLLNQRTATVAQEFYRNGNLEATSATSTTGIAANAFPFFVFRNNNSGAPSGDQPGTTLRHYSIGLSMTTSQVAAFHGAMATFHAAMGRTQ
jgi:hypothetical protein